jgi:hypothetical protein
MTEIAVAEIVDGLGSFRRRNASTVRIPVRGDREDRTRPNCPPQGRPRLRIGIIRNRIQRRSVAYEQNGKSALVVLRLGHAIARSCIRHAE